MKLPRLTLALVIAAFALLLPLRSVHADQNLGATVTVIALPTDLSVAFNSEHDLQKDGEASFKALLKLVADKSAAVIANPSVTTKSGQRASSSSSGMYDLELEPVVSPAGDVVESNIEFSLDKNKIVTSTTSKPGENRYLGSFNASAGSKALTCYVFLRVDLAK